MKKHLIVYILVLSAFSIQADGVNLTKVKQLTCQQYYPACQTCTKNQFLLPFNSFSSDPDALEVEADQSEITEKDNYLITGNVKLRSKDHYLSADKILVSKENLSSILSGIFYLFKSVVNIKTLLALFQDPSLN